jgi:hypothetical protein
MPSSRIKVSGERGQGPVEGCVPRTPSSCFQPFSNNAQNSSQKIGEPRWLALHGCQPTVRRSLELSGASNLACYPVAQLGVRCASLAGETLRLTLVTLIGVAERLESPIIQA